MDVVREHPTAVIAAGLAAAWWLSAYVRGRKANPYGLPLPPGPTGYPIIGSLLEMPTYKPELVYDKWLKTYGDMVYLKVLGQGFLILGSVERTYDIFEKRSSNYADRPRLPMLMEVMGSEFNFGLIQYGTWWRRQRRAFHDFFHPNVVNEYQPIQLSSTRAFLRYLLKSPDKFMYLIRQSFAASIMKIAYGITIQEMDDPYVYRAQQALHGLAEAAVPGNFLVDLLPIMKYIPSWFPGAEWKRKGDDWRETNHRVVMEPFELVKKQMEEGTAVPSVAATLIQGLPNKDSPEHEEEEAKARNVCAVAFIGGADTTVSVVQAVFLAMCLHPEVQTKAQAELDSVLKGRLPEFSDRPYLPYIVAITKEIMRWHVITPSGMAHMATEDDEYDGYFIPKGIIVIGNTWSILRDKKAFKDPHVFDPERYLKDGKINPEVRDPAVATFGYGRRICAGRFFSANSLFITVAHVLAVYDIKPELDENGKEIEVKAEFTSGIISYPLPFKCRITPRSRVAEELIRNSELME